MGFHWERGHSVAECLTWACDCGSVHMDISGNSMTCCLRGRSWNYL
jgi:hypothetical protein